MIGCGGRGPWRGAVRRRSTAPVRRPDRPPPESVTWARSSDASDSMASHTASYPDMPTGAKADANGALPLPGWYDTFVDGQRELVRQMRLRTPESHARRLREQQEWAQAMRLALAAMTQAPLRETTH